MRKRSQYTYGSVPMIYHSRSKFDLSYSHKTTMNVGDLVPLYCQEIYPGDSFKCDANVVARVTSSFLKPVMDNLFCDVMFFFVPSRTVFNKWAEIFGENNDGPWARQSVVSAPVIAGGPSYSVQPGSLCNYLGLPVGLSSAQLANSTNGVSELPFRAYAKIYNEWYRDENLIEPVHIRLDSSVGYFNDDNFGPNNYLGKCAKVAKMHDYFTQLLPAPQKGDSVNLGTGTFPATQVPVVTGSNQLSRPTDAQPLNFFWQGVTTTANQYFPLYAYGWGGGSPYMGTLRANTAETGNVTSPVGIVPANLWADIPATPISAVDVNDLRYAFQLQKMLERDAIFGTRYTEYLQGHFGVTSPDARLQRSEFLGGRRFPLSVLQATQTSQATTDSPLGNVAGWSLSNGRSGYTKGFTEHGFVIGMFCIRQFHTYQQGIERFLTRKNRVDFLDPLFTTIGYQPVFTREIYAFNGNPANRDQVLGYAPAFEDCRCRQNRVSGQLATASNSGLDIWHFADNYSSAPVLGKEFIEETSLFVDRTLSVPSSTVDNFIVDVYFKQYAIRVMPTYGMPGLIDHH